MDVALKLVFAAMAVVMFALGDQARAQSTHAFGEPQTEKYSQSALLKNWALSVCLATVAKNVSEREDANATASAYLEFGRQPIDAYDALRALVERYAHRKYGGSIKSEFNTMKCIDLFHSKDLDALARKLSSRK